VEVDFDRQVIMVQREGRRSHVGPCPSLLPLATADRERREVLVSGGHDGKQKPVLDLLKHVLQVEG
jgi:hypothetical protein